METTKQYTKRTREEVIAWLNKARDIKKKRQQEAEEWYNERARLRKEAEESHYFECV